MKKILYLAIGLVLFSGCAAQKKVVPVGKEASEVVLKNGQSCEIEFITNASTGFWWQWVNEDDVDIVESVGSRYESNAPKGVVGASSTRFWKFKALRKGSQTLRFVYARESIKEPARVRDVVITVK